MSNFAVNFLSNAAYSETYRQTFFQAATDIFANKRQPENQTQQKLFGQYTLHIDEYDCGSYCQIFDLKGNEIANWQSIDHSSDFYTPIQHQNGKPYLLFRQDLYGYSVLDCETGQIFSYFPQKVLDGEEDFIWTDVHYNPHNNMLAVGDCYWACPYDILLFQWDNPMNMLSSATLISRHLPNYFDDYDGDVDFHSWQDGDLCYTAKRLHAQDVDVEIISENEYAKWFNP